MGELRSQSRAAAAQVWSAEPNEIDSTSHRLTGFGVDWITGVTHQVSESARLATWSKKVYRSEMKMGGLERGWGMAGFSGWKVGQVEFGVLNDMSMVRIHSEAANFWWRDVYRLSDHVTRIDLQMTYDIGENPQSTIWNLFALANRESGKKKRGPKNDCIIGSDGGATCYCGRRQSNVFGRAYARGPKSKREEDKHLLRFEVQFNERLAGMVTRRLAASRSPATYIRGQVAGFFRVRTGFAMDHAADVPNNCLSRDVSDCDRKLRWLQKSVQQSCVTLVERGMTKELIAALGLEEFVELRRSTT